MMTKLEDKLNKLLEKEENKKKQILITNNTQNGKIDFSIKYKNYKDEQEASMDVLLALTQYVFHCCDNSPEEAVHTFKTALMAFSDDFNDYKVEWQIDGEDNYD